MGSNTYAFASIPWLVCLSFHPLETSIFPPNRINGRDDGKRTHLYKLYQRTVASFKTHSISENMNYYETLLHFSTEHYQDVGGAEGARELMVRSPQI